MPSVREGTNPTCCLFKDTRWSSSSACFSRDVSRPTGFQKYSCNRGLFVNWWFRHLHCTAPVLTDGVRKRSAAQVYAVLPQLNCGRTGLLNHRFSQKTNCSANSASIPATIVSSVFLLIHATRIANSPASKRVLSREKFNAPSRKNSSGKIMAESTAGGT